MRHFPRTARRRALAATSVVALSVGALSSPVPALADDLKDKKREVQRDLDAARGQLGESSKALRQATIRWRKSQKKLLQARERLDQVEGRVRVAKARDAALQRELDQARAELQQAREELRRGKEDVRRQQDEVADVIDDFYTRGGPELLTASALLDAGGPSEVTRRMEYRDVVVGGQERAYSELRATKVLLQVRETKVEQARDAVRDRRRAAAEHLAGMRELESEAAAATQQVRRRTAAKNEARQQARQVRQRDAAALQELRQEKDRISEMLRKRAAAARRRAEARARARARRRAESRSTPSRGSSRSAGGFLTQPVNGYITSSYGYRTHPIYGYRSLHDGVDFGAGCGAPMRAGADGTVVSRYFQTAYGNRLIVDHGYHRGVGLATIYNHAQRYTVSPGEHVERGEVIGYMGTTGWSTGCHLHFTVTENGSTVDPLGWL